MRKFTVAFVVFIVVVVTFYGIWLQFPKARNTEVVAEAYKVTNERLNEMLAQADDPELNGFLNPYFVPYWGRRSIEQKEGSPASQTIMAWGEYSTPYQGEKVDHKTLQSEGDEGYSKALADMEKAVPELREAMNKPLSCLRSSNSPRRRKYPIISPPARALKPWWDWPKRRSPRAKTSKRPETSCP